MGPLPYQNDFLLSFPELDKHLCQLDTKHSMAALAKPRNFISVSITKIIEAWKGEYNFTNMIFAYMVMTNTLHIPVQFVLQFTSYKGTDMHYMIWTSWRLELPKT